MITQPGSPGLNALVDTEDPNKPKASPPPTPPPGVQPVQPIMPPAQPSPPVGTNTPQPPVPSVPPIAPPASPVPNPPPVPPTGSQPIPPPIPAPTAPGAPPVSAAPAPYVVGSGLNPANPNATAGNPFSGMTSAEGGGFGPAAGTHHDAAGILGILGGQPGQYDALAGRLAANPAAYAQWQGILNNDPAQVHAAMTGGDPELAAMAKQYAQRNADDSGIAFGPQGQTWRDLAAGTYKAPMSAPPAPINIGEPLDTGLTAAPGGGPLAPGAPSINTQPAGLPGLSAGSPFGLAPVGNGISEGFGIGNPAQPPGPTPISPTVHPNGAVGGVNTSPALSGVTPENALTNQRIDVGPTADRFKIAGDQYDAAVKAGEPQYQASLRDALRTAAAGGALGSGKLQSSIGDVQSNRENALSAQRQGFLSNALEGTIGDAFNRTGVAQQQQGFQNQQQTQAFQQQLQKLLTGDQLTNSGFNRDLQRLLAGNQGDPSQLLLTLSGLTGNQAGQAGASLAQLLSGIANKNAAGSSGLDVQALLKQLMAGYGGGTTQPTVDTSTP